MGTPTNEAMKTVAPSSMRVRAVRVSAVGEEAGGDRFCFRDDVLQIGGSEVELGDGGGLVGWGFRSGDAREHVVDQIVGGGYQVGGQVGLAAGAIVVVEEGGVYNAGG